MEKVNKKGLSNFIHLLLGDATRLSEINQIGDKTFDKITAMDCAYHFNSRQEFFKQSSNRLRAGGILCIVDMVPTEKLLANNFKSKAFLQMICTLAKIPKANMVSMEEYQDQLKSCGFEIEKVQFLEDSVFPGFVNHLRKCDDLIGLYLSPIWLISERRVASPNSK